MPGEQLDVHAGQRQTRASWIREHHLHRHRLRKAAPCVGRACQSGRSQAAASARRRFPATSFSNSARARGIGALVAFGEDQFVLQGVFQAGEFGHPHLVAMRFQKSPRSTLVRWAPNSRRWMG